MDTRREAPNRPQAILWIAAALLLATLASHLRVSVCVGTCAAHEAASACCAAVTEQPAAACCGCCGAEDETSAPDSAVRDEGSGTNDASAGKPCCTTIGFEGVDWTPAPAAVELPSAQHLAFTLPTPPWLAPLRRPLTRGRPFDRGPPRVDARTRLRASTVLLI